MSRDDLGKLSFTLKDVGTILGVLLSLAAVAGLIGGGYWVKFQVEQHGKDIEVIRLRQVQDVQKIETVLKEDHYAFNAHVQKDAAQDVILERLLTRLDTIQTTLVEIKTAQRGGSTTR